VALLVPGGQLQHGRVWRWWAGGRTPGGSPPQHAAARPTRASPGPHLAQPFTGSHWVHPTPPSVHLSQTIPQSAWGRNLLRAALRRPGRHSAQPVWAGSPSRAPLAPLIASFSATYAGTRSSAYPGLQALHSAPGAVRLMLAQPATATRCRQGRQVVGRLCAKGREGLWAPCGLH
jgi:hypothetical protein